MAPSRARWTILLLLALAPLAAGGSKPASGKGKAKPKPSPAATAGTTDPDIRPDEVAIWSAVLRTVFPDGKKTYALVDHTGTDSNRGRKDIWKALRYLKVV